jgi:hypothetical protein
VNDLERDLQEVLHEDARRVPTPTSAPEGLRRSVRRRQAVFGSVVGLSALAIVAGIVAGTTMLLPIESEPRPGVEGGELKTGTLNGIMITYPTAWYRSTRTGRPEWARPDHAPRSSSRCPARHHPRSPASGPDDGEPTFS